MSYNECLRFITQTALNAEDAPESTLLSGRSASARHRAHIRERHARSRQQAGLDANIAVGGRL